MHHTANTDPFGMLRTRLRAHGSRLSKTLRENNSRTGQWLRIFYKTISIKRNLIKEQHFLPNRNCQILVSLVDNISNAPGTLVSMACDKHSEVRTAVADNKTTPLPTLLLLAQDQNSDVRFSLAENNNLPAVVLAVLTEDENPYVAVRAKDNLAKRVREGKSALTKPFEGIFQHSRPGWAVTL